MGFFQFLFSKSFLKNAALAVVVLIIAVFIVHLRLAQITLHNEEIGVPDFRGQHISEIESLLESKKLRMTVIDSLYDRSLNPGEIIQQDPAPGSMVKENRRIYFTINSHTAPLVKLPSLVDQSKRQALATLEILELGVEKISYKVSLYDGLVLDVLYKDQSVAEGADLPLGSRVQLVIGESSDLPRVVMPNLLGLRIDQIDSALSAYGLNKGMIIDCIQCETADDSSMAKVIRTYPQYSIDKRVRMGSTVDIWLSNAVGDSIR